MHDDGAVPGGDDSAAAPAREGPVDGFPAGTDPRGELGLAELERNLGARHLVVVRYAVAFQVAQEPGESTVGVITGRACDPSLGVGQPSA